MKNLYFLGGVIFITLICISFISAETFGYNLLRPGVNLNPALNGSTIFGNLTNLSQMQDVNGSGWINDYFLQWDNSNSLWQAVAVAPGGGGDNESWNETKADGKYIFQSNEGNLNVNSSTWWAGLTDWVEGWFNSSSNLLDFNFTKGNDFWCSLTGCTMSGDIIMSNKSITNILRTEYNISGCTDETPGTLCTDPDYDTLRYVTESGQVLQMNQETTMPTKNIEGSTVADGSVVYIMGATGANPNFKFAKADNLSTSGLVGVVTKECINNQVCPVVFFGLIHDFDTSPYVAGDHLYISATEEGNFTTTPPEFPNVPIWVATVIRVHATEGTIFVFPRLDSANGITMNNLGLVGDFIQTDYKIISEPGNAAIGQNVFTIQMNGTSGIDIPHLVLQPGGSGQASAWVRSGMVVPESVLCLNNTNRTEPGCFANESGYTWEIADFDTSISEGADWGVTGELEVIKGAYFHENITLSGSINDNNTASRVYFNVNGTFVVEG